MLSPRTLFLAFCTIVSKSQQSQEHVDPPAVEDSDYFSQSVSSSEEGASTPPTPEIPQQSLRRRVLVGSPENTPPQLTKITIDELKRANTADKAWVAIRGKVYDLTAFASRHPGGRNLILMAAGKDVTPLFETSHGPKEFRTLYKFHIGMLSGKDLPGFPPPDTFSVTLKRRVAEHFAKHKIDFKHSPTAYVRYALTFALLCGLYTVQWSNLGLSWFYTVAVAYGLLQAQWACSAVHDGSHGAAGHNPAFWNLLVAGHDFINGSSGTLWIYQHVFGHHPYTNIEDCDTDIETNDVDFRRIKESQIYRWFYRLQPVYAPLLYVLLGCSVRYEDFVNYFGSHRGAMKVNPFTPTQNAIFFGGKAFFVASRLVAPFLYTTVPTKHILGAFFVSDFVFSFTLAIIFQASHVVTDVDFPLPNPNTGDMDVDWMRLQVETAQDYAHDQPITTFLVGALNYQIVHHLFPNVAQQYAMDLGHIVRETTKEFGVRYEIKSTLWEAIGGHIGLLSMMGRPPHAH